MDNVASMARRIQITFDAADPHTLARWWVSLLGYQLADSHERVARLLADGLVTESDVVRIEGRLFLADFVAATDPENTGPRLFFQRVPEPKTAKNRLHLDVSVDAAQLDREVERLRAAGATLVGYNEYPGHRAALMRDPEGNEFDLH
jgi:catechol 2,3-dioxygenase-like lactoylglutathione lyase family enzyme